jgi:hypothetical protein
MRSTKRTPPASMSWPLAHTVTVGGTSTAHTQIARSVTTYGQRLRTQMSTQSRSATSCGGTSTERDRWPWTGPAGEGEDGDDTAAVHAEAQP